jgi:hypothetical protein
MRTVRVAAVSSRLKRVTLCSLIWSTRTLKLLFHKTTSVFCTSCADGHMYKLFNTSFSCYTCFSYPRFRISAVCFSDVRSITSLFVATVGYSAHARWVARSFHDSPYHFDLVTSLPTRVCVCLFFFMRFYIVEPILTTFGTMLEASLEGLGKILPPTTEL